MVLEVSADPGDVRDDRDPEATERVRRTDPGELQQLRRVEGTAREDHLAGEDRLRSAAPPLDLDAGSAAAVDVNPGDERPRPDGKVWSPHDRMEIRPRGADPTAAPDVPVERGEALLAIAVHIRRQVIAGLLGRLEPGEEERARGRSPLEAEGTVVATPRVIGSRGGAVLHPLEVRQAVGERPRLHSGIGGPALVVERISALEDH